MVGGGKKKRRGKNYSTVTPFFGPTESQFFARVIKNLGSCRFQLDVFFYVKNSINDKTPVTDNPNSYNLSFDHKTKNGVVRGNMIRRKYINAGDIVLVSERDFETSKVDIIHVYPNHHMNKIRYNVYAPEELFGNNGEVGEIDFNDSDEDFGADTIDISTKNKPTRKTDRNENYMASIGLPENSYSDDNDVGNKSQKTYDEYGNEC
tara:strand:+ start:66 stop:683 length:618 start_codon:yes stop_codon:yes gene_type:complete